MRELTKNKNNLDYIEMRNGALALASNDYAFYCELTHDFLWKPYRHSLFVADVTEEALNGHIKRLILTMPPQHGKSMTITETAPSYYLGRNPEKHVMELSYGDEFAKRFGRKNKEKVDRFGRNIFGIELAQDSKAKGTWHVKEYGGSMISRGIGGSVAGNPADLIIFDDPIKNPKEAYSKTYRDNVWDFYSSVVSGRVRKDTIIIIITTRWHKDDLVGRLLEHDIDHWTLINLPALAEENDPLGREIGEALCPEIQPKELLENKKKQVGNKFFNSLWGGNPAEEEGTQFKRDKWQFHKFEHKNFHEKIISVDAAFKDVQTSSYVVIQVWGRIGIDKYLLDQFRFKGDIIETISKFVTMCERHKDASAKIIEDKANGTAIIQLLKSKISGLVPIQATDSKEVRSLFVLPQQEAGQLYLPHSSVCDFTEDFVDECASFPFGVHDDQVDAMVHAVTYLTKNSSLDPKSIFTIKRTSSTLGF